MMNDFLFSLVKASLISVILFGSFMLILRTLSFFSVNRMVLNAIIPISVFVAFFPVQSNVVLPITPVQFEPSFNEYFGEVGSTNIELTESTLLPDTSTIFGSIYILGVLFMIFLTLKKIQELRKIARNGNRKKEGFALVELSGITPSSFFNYIFINPDIEASQRAIIIKHEKVHQKLFHSIDVIILQIYKAIFWFNPIVYLLEKELKLVHEYQVDKRVLSSNTKSEDYLNCLLQAASSPKSKHALTHQFYNHPLKNRIKMILKAPSKPFQLIKYSFLLIVIAFSAFAFSNSKVVNSSSKNLAAQIANLPEPTADPNRPSILPIKNYIRIASPFGYRFHPITKDSKLHKGVDFKAPKGTPVYATANGIVSEADTVRGYGIHIVIRNSKVYETHFAHLSQMLVKEGEKVEKGQLIAKVGSTGLSSAPHLHYEVLENGKHVNPAFFMPKQ